MGVEVSKTEGTIEKDKLQMNVTVTNVGSEKLSQVSVCPTNITSPPVTSQHITKSLKPGVSKTKSVEIPLEPGVRTINFDLCLSCEGLPDLQCHLQLPTSIWLVTTSADTETFAELLLGGSLSFMQSKQISLDTTQSRDFGGIVTQITSKLSVSQVEVQDSSASLYAQSSDGSRLCFLVKMTSGGISLEGRGED